VRAGSSMKSGGRIGGTIVTGGKRPFNIRRGEGSFLLWWEEEEGGTEVLTQEERQKIKDRP